MAGRRRIPAAGDNHEQEEVEEIAALSPRTSLGDLHRKIDRVMDNFELLNRRMDELPAPPRLEANAANGHNFDDRRGWRARGNQKNFNNQRDVRGTGIHSAEQNHRERRFGAQERRRPVQDYQEPLPRNQDYNQELQDWSSIDDEWQERTLNDHNRRF